VRNKHVRDKMGKKQWEKNNGKKTSMLGIKTLGKKQACKG
jgi:hypothetical protein